MTAIRKVLSVVVLGALAFGVFGIGWNIYQERSTHWETVPTSEWNAMVDKQTRATIPTGFITPKTDKTYVYNGQTFARDMLVVVMRADTVAIEDMAINLVKLTDGIIVGSDKRERSYQIKYNVASFDALSKIRTDLLRYPFIESAGFSKAS